MTMTFRDLVFQEDVQLVSPLLNAEAEQSPLRGWLANQSPIMKAWFVIMIVNLGLFLFLLR